MSYQPPYGYVCRICNVPGHWIEECPSKYDSMQYRKPYYSGRRTQRYQRRSNYPQYYERRKNYYNHQMSNYLRHQYNFSRYWTQKYTKNSKTYNPPSNHASEIEDGFGSNSELEEEDTSWTETYGDYYNLSTSNNSGPAPKTEQAKLKKNVKRAIDHELLSKILVNGYIRLINKDLTVLIPFEVYLIVYDIYYTIHPPRQFGYYNPNIFKVTKDPYIITPIGLWSGGYVIYPSPNGFSEGTHTWSVKYIKNNGNHEGTRSIGVTSIFKKKWVKSGIGSGSWHELSATDDEWWSYHDGCGKWNNWKVGSTMTVTIDIDNEWIKYYRDGKKIKHDTLERDAAPYYFALCIIGYKDCGVFQSVLSE